jgi:4-hydroxy 2-oxovalerate aldolase
MVSGAGSLPQKDVMDWVSKRYISVNSIIRALQGQQQPDAGTGKLPLFVPGKKYQTAIIVGGGPSVTEHAAAIVQFCNQHPDACLVHASSKNAGIFQQLENDQFFCLVGNEGHRMEAAFGSLADVHGTCVLPPYPRKMGTYIPAAAIGQAAELADISFTDRYRDSHTAIALQTAIELGALEVYLLGYDGYAGLAPNSKEQDLAEENNYLLAKAAHLFRRFASLTATRYNTVQPLSVYQFIQ